jgi:hypothetical protein
MSALDSATEPFLKRGFLLDSLRVSRAIRSLTQGLSEDQLLIFQDNRRSDPGRLSGEFVFRRLDSTTLAPTLRTLLKPEPERWGEALDLILMVEPPEFEKAVVVSLPAIALRQAAREPKLWAEVKTSLDALVTRYPEDFSVMTAAALAACAEGDRGAMLEAVGRLERLVAARPLDRLPDASRGNASQQAEATKRLALWLVSRECRQFEETGELGRGLAREAMEAARRQPDHRWLLAMLRISGQDALHRGDRDQAEADWARMLDITLADPAPRKDRRPAPSPSSLPAGTGPGNPTTVPAPEVSRRPRTLSIDRFEQAMKIACLAAENDLHTLSVRAVLESLGGPPVPPAASESLSGRSVGVNARVNVTSPYVSSQNSVFPSSSRGVWKWLEELDRLWKTRNAPPEAVYHALREAIMPSDQPDKILMYEPQFPNTVIVGDGKRLPSEVRVKRVASILAEWAVRAGKADELRHRIEQRQASPTARASGQLILSSLAAAEQEESSR